MLDLWFKMFEIVSAFLIGESVNFQYVSSLIGFLVWCIAPEGIQ